VNETQQVRKRLAMRAAQVSSFIDRLLPTTSQGPGIIHDAMRYSLLPGGKRLRPTLLLETAALLGADEERFLPAAGAIELIHTYSLVHDDLPAMDDDDLRRGKPSSHRVYGEGIAILTGDALLTLGFEQLAKTGAHFPGRAARVLEAVYEVARAIGTMGMIGGQVLDLDSEGHDVELDELRRIHRMKTGCLFEATMRFPAIVLNAPPEKLDAVTEYARRFGVAFQITDDILDVVGDEAVMGKRRGSDSASNKATYPGLLGLDEARVEARRAVREAIGALEPFGARAAFLVDLARLMLDRDR